MTTSSVNITNWGYGIALYLVYGVGANGFDGEMDGEQAHD